MNEIVMGIRREKKTVHDNSSWLKRKLSIVGKEMEMRQEKKKLLIVGKVMGMRLQYSES